MRWSDLPLDPSARTLRQFAGLWVVLFGGLALWAGAHDLATRAVVFGALALTIGPAGFVWPAVVRPVFVGWLIAAFPIGWVVSRVLLVGLFASIVPVAVFFRLRRRDPLQLRRRTDRTTYWARKGVAGNVRSYLRQF
jgi:hypothetical protein